MPLTQDDRKRLDKALEDSFPAYFDLRKLLSEEIEWPGEIEYRLENIVSDKLPQDQVRLELINWADKYGLTECLVKGAASVRSQVPAWKDLITDLFSAPPSGAAAAPARPPFVLNWLGLERIRRRVCLLEKEPEGPDLPAKELATAVLIGPDIVATTYLALGEFIFAKDNPGRPPLQVRFDYLGVASTPSRRSGIPTLLADNWLFAADIELDIALLRLSERRGDDTLNGPLPEPRRWMRLHGDGAENGDPIVILQHPRGRPVSLSFGVIRQSKWGSKRISYSAGVQPCSIGAPCFDAELRLVALHQCPHQEGNRGIRVDAIRGYLNDQGLELED